MELAEYIHKLLEISHEERVDELNELTKRIQHLTQSNVEIQNYIEENQSNKEEDLTEFIKALEENKYTLIRLNEKRNKVKELVNTWIKNEKELNQIETLSNKEEITKENINDLKVDENEGMYL